MDRYFKNILLYFSFFFFFSFLAKAQIYPPELLCVDSDTLVWNAPSNTCGAFVSYQIYGSTALTGPFVLLQSITDPTETTWLHDEANELTWYYYMTTEANCPGETTLASDTLNNMPPQDSPIQAVDIVNGGAYLSWEASPSPEVVAYIIYKVTEIGTVPIDTVTSLNYLDVNSNTDIQVENYYVVALDACGNTSLLSTPHQTVLLNGELNACDRSIELHWTLYKGWAAIQKQELWVSINGDSPMLLQTLSGIDTTTTVTHLNDESEYCFFIESYDALHPAVSASSNAFCLYVDIISPVRFLQIKNISLNEQNQATVSWQWNQDAEISDYSILYANAPSSLQIVETLPSPVSLPLNNYYSYTPPTPTGSHAYFQISTTDLCGDKVQSNSARSILLNGVATEQLENQLSWTALGLDSTLVLAYEVYRFKDNQSPVLVATLLPEELSWSQSVNPRVVSDANICYYVQAIADINIGGHTEQIVSRSNTICIAQPTSILTPNAFAPSGVNYEFKPILRFGYSVDYQLTIWDRWGQKVFQSNDVLTGWTGRKGYFEYPQGVYTYYIRVKQSNGNEVEKKGTVFLLR